MNVFRRVILPIAFLVILLVIAGLLAWIAFKPAEGSKFDDMAATGEPAASVITAERGSIVNTLELKGKIAVDSPTAVKAKYDGKVNHFFVEPGDEVLKGAKLFQVTSDGGSEAPSGGTEESGAGAAGAGAGADAADAASADGTPAPAKPRYYTVVAPADGTVNDFQVEKNDTVSADTQVTELRKKSFKAKATVNAVDLYRIPKIPETANITITDGPEPFDCEKLRLDQGAGAAKNKAPSPEEGGAESGGGMDDSSGGEDPGAGSDSGDGPELGCTIPSKVTVYNGLELTMKVDAGKVDDAIVVPVTAVRGLTDKGTVWVVNDEGETEEREIEVGLNDGAMVEVKKGLEEGTEVEEFVPGTEPETDEADDSGMESGMAVDGTGF